MEVFTVDECWLDGWHGASTIVADENGFRFATKDDAAPIGHVQGTIFPGFRDAHVHLGLVDPAALIAGGIAVVHDLGWELDAATSWLGGGFDSDAVLPKVSIVGQLLTTPEGYPTKSGWAPRGAIREIGSPDEVPAAVDDQLDVGAAFIKIALNSDVGPVFDDAILRTIVDLAHERGVTVAAHAQGEGQARRAFDAGVDLLAHAPWSERISNELLDAMAMRMAWVSTLDIHGWGTFTRDFATANDNVRRFHEAGGEIRYGTDLGNGPLPVGINERELLALEHAGLELDALAAAIAPASASGGFGERISRITADRDDAPAHWLSTAHLIDPLHLKEHFA